MMHRAHDDHRPLRTLLFGALLAGTMILLTGQPAQADFSSGSFSYSGSTCSDHVDPIGVVLYGVNADSDRSRSLIQSRMGWGGDTGGGQYGISHGYCTLMDGQAYSACGTCDRDHVRLNQTHHPDALGRRETVGTPHREIRYPCGHAVTSFTDAKYYLIGQMSYLYGISYQYWGNTETQLQCSGVRVGGDGQVGWINIG